MDLNNFPKILNKVVCALTRVVCSRHRMGMYLSQSTCPHICDCKNGGMIDHFRHTRNAKVYLWHIPNKNIFDTYRKRQHRILHSCLYINDNFLQVFLQFFPLYSDFHLAAWVFVLSFLICMVAFWLFSLCICSFPFYDIRISWKNKLVTPYWEILMWWHNFHVYSDDDYEVKNWRLQWLMRTYDTLV